MVKGGCRVYIGSVIRLMRTRHINHLHQLSSRIGVYYSSEHSSLLLLLSHPVGLSKTHGDRVTCLLKIRISRCRLAAALIAARSPTSSSLDSFLVGRATIVPLATSSHGNVRLDSVEPAGAADNSDVPAAAMFQARSFGSARRSSRSSAQVRHSRPSCSRPVARAHRRYRLQP